MLVCELLNMSTNCICMSDENPDPEGMTYWILAPAVGNWLQTIKKIDVKTTDILPCIFIALIQY